MIARSCAVAWCLALGAALAGGVSASNVRTFAIAEDVEPRTCDEALAALDADRADVRARAERWLARELTAADGPRVRAALVSASAEARERIIGALASAATGFDLAVRIALDPASELAAAGDAALRERVARWSPGWKRAPSTRGQTLARLNEETWDYVQLDARAGDGRLDLALGLLQRGARELPPLVLAPDVAARVYVRAPVNRAPRPSPIAALAPSLAGSLARAYGVELAGHDLGELAPEGAHPWILVHAANGAARPAAELVVEWASLAASQTNAEPLRRAAARALGACGWPDALAWLAERRRADVESLDLVWLDGVLAPVDRGVVAPLLRDAGEQARLWEYVRDASREPLAELRRERLPAIARALAAAGPRTADGARSTLPAARADESTAAQWVRFVAWETRAPLAADEVTFLDARIAELGRDASSASCALLLQALRARAAAISSATSAAEALVLERPETSFEWASRAGRVPVLARALAASGVTPPPRWDDPAALPSDWSVELRAAALAWELAARHAGVQHLAAFVASESADVSERLAALRTLARSRAGDELQRAFGELAASEATRAAEWWIALGPTSSGANAELAQRALANALGRNPLDVLAASVLGARTASGDGRARERLLAALAADVDSRAARSGVSTALALLRDAADEDGERELLVAARRVKLAGPQDVEPWPAEPRLTALDLAAEDRDLPAELLAPAALPAAPSAAPRDERR